VDDLFDALETSGATLPLGIVRGTEEREATVDLTAAGKNGLATSVREVLR
jgi:hypothetical protein